MGEVIQRDRRLCGTMQLVNGIRVTLRPVQPQDKDMHRAFVRVMSEDARYFRFMTKLTELSESMAEGFTSVDNYTHVALIVEVNTEAGAIMIAEARYIMDADDPLTCEFALAVADNWRRLGLARTLLALLIEHATSSGIRRMVADTISANRPMIGLAERIGFTVSRKREDCRLMSFVKELRPHACGSDAPALGPAGRAAAA